MAHKRKDTLTVSSEWAKHLRLKGKRQFHKAERQAAKVLEDDDFDQVVIGHGLTKDSEKMRWMREHDGKTVIPRGIYCYDKVNCPYWDNAENEENQGNGFCWFLMEGDWTNGGGELWDQCKICGVNEGESPEGTLGVEDERPET